MQQKPLQIDRIPVSGLSHDPDNARARGPRAVEAIAKSLEAFGQQKPIVVTEGGVVIAGNGTLDAAKLLGWEALDCQVADLSPAQARAFAVADNRTAELAYWKDAQLLAALEAAQESDLLEATAFDANTLEQLQRAAEAEEDNDAEAALGAVVNPRSDQAATALNGVRSLMLPFPEYVYSAVVQAFAEQRKEHGVNSNSEALLAILGIELEEQA